LWLVTASVPLDRYGAGPLEASLRDLDWVSSIALAHEAVVEHYVRSPGASVIPMKLFTMFSTDGRAAAEMRSRRRELDRVFERIAGCEEWGVRVMQGQPRRARRPAAGPLTGAAFLRSRKEARDETRQAAAATADAAAVAYDALSEIAKEARRRGDEPVAGVVPPALDAAFLVPVRRRARFRAAAERLARNISETGGQLTLSGPWPAYNFVSPPSRRSTA
jgi:hypothetical protein